MTIRTASIGAILLGSIYTIFRKYQGVAEISHSTSKFNQPIIQAFVIFVGMTLICLFQSLIPKDKQEQGKQKPSKYVYIIPSLLDVGGTITDTAGLFYTSVSVSQMLKGSVLLFTYLITILCSKKCFKFSKHLYMFMVLFSLLVIGYSNLDLQNDTYQSNPLLGNLLVITSQFLFALMFICEQSISRKYNMQVAEAVSWEGIWGVCISGFFILIFSCFDSPLNCNLFQTAQLLYNNTHVLIAMIITAVCIAPFNYFGLKITKETSALQRCLVCTSRMVVVWMVSLKIGWETFSMIQLLGYILLLFSIEKFNQVEKEQTLEKQQQLTPIKQMHNDD